MEEPSIQENSTCPRTTLECALLEIRLHRPCNSLVRAHFCTVYKVQYIAQGTPVEFTWVLPQFTRRATGDTDAPSCHLCASRCPLPCLITLAPQPGRFTSRLASWLHQWHKGCCIGNEVRLQGRRDGTTGYTDVRDGMGMSWMRTTLWVGW